MNKSYKNLLKTLRKAFVILVISTSISIPSLAQRLEWIKDVHQLQNSWMEYTSTLDKEENVHVLGRFSNQIVLDSTHSLSNGKGMYMAKYNKKGKVQWLKGILTVGQSTIFPKSCCTDDSMNLYITGTFANQVDFDPGINQSILTTNSSLNYNLFIAKYSKLGNLIWAKQIGRPNSTGLSNHIEEPYGLRLSHSNNISLVGWFKNDSLDLDPSTNTSYLHQMSEDYNSFIAYYNLNGSFLTGKNLGSFVITDFEIDKEDNMYCAISAKDTIDLDLSSDSAIFNFANYESIALVKYNQNGDYLWASQIQNTYPTSLFSSSYKIALDDSFNLLLTGNCKQQLEIIHGNSNTIVPLDSFSLFIAKFDTIGNPIWVRNLDNLSNNNTSTNSIMGLIANSMGDIYLGGSNRKRIDFDPSSNSTIHQGTGFGDAFMVKYDNSGNLKWFKSFIGSSVPSHFSYHSTLNLSKSGYLYTTGCYRDTIGILTDTGAINMYSSLPGEFLSKYKDCDWKHLFKKKICIGDSVFLEGEFRSTNGNYFDSLVAVDGCDSLVITELMIDTITDNITEVAQICDGETYTFPDGQTSTTSGIHLSRLLKVSGCDSLISTVLFVNPKHFLSEEQHICNHDSIAWSGTYVSLAGDYYDSLKTTTGCDSIHHMKLVVNPSYASSDTLYICHGDSVLFVDKWYKEEGTYDKHLTTKEGCDSLLTLHLKSVKVDISILEKSKHLTAIQDNAEYTWIDCTTQKPAFGLNNLQHYSPLYSSKFAAIIKLKGCVDTTSCVRLQIPDIHVFPNPNDGHFYVSSPYDLAEYFMFDSKGAFVAKGTLYLGLNQIYKKHLSSGMYSLKIVTQFGDEIVRKVIIQ